MEISEIPLSEQNSEPSAKVTVQNGWSVSPWLSLASHPAMVLDLPVGQLWLSALDGNIDVHVE